MVADTPRLGPFEAHCWRVRLDGSQETAAAYHATLSDDERGRSARLRFDRDRRRFIVARGTLRALLGRYLEAEPADLRFTYNPFGKPELSAEFGGWLRFNLSHSGGLALIGVAREADIGVDLEQLRVDPDHEDIARHFFPAADIEYVQRLPIHLRHRGFFRCWTRQEAMAKAMGEGLPVRDLHGAWTLYDFQPAPGFVGALAVAGHGWRLQLRAPWDSRPRFSRTGKASMMWSRRGRRILREATPGIPHARPPERGARRSVLGRA